MSLIRVLLFVLSALTTVCTAEDPKDVWSKKYGVIFGGKAGAQEVDVRTLVDYVKYLGNNADKLGFDDDQVEKAKFWANALTHVEADQCHADQWRELDVKYFEMIEDNQEPHHDVLYELARQVLVESCSKHYENIGQLLREKVGGKSVDKIKKLEKEFTGIPKPYGQEARKELLSMARKVAGVSSRSSKDKFAHGWADGACAKVLSKLSEPEMEQYADFIHLIYRSKRADRCSPTVQFWLNVIEMCHQLEGAFVDQQSEQ